MNISSVAGLKGSPGSFAYAAPKWALRGMTKSAAIDLGGRKIRVNSVHPGPIDTDMLGWGRRSARNDTLNGGAGNDTLVGGAGSDVFSFELAHAVEHVPRRWASGHRPRRH